MEVRFERLADCDKSYMIIEGEWGNIKAFPYQGRVTPKSLLRTWISWSARFPKTHWMFLPDRPTAENVTFRILLNYWRKYVDTGMRKL